MVSAGWGSQILTLRKEARLSRRAHNPQSGGSTELKKFGKSTPRYVSTNLKLFFSSPYRWAGFVRWRCAFGVGT